MTVWEYFKVREKQLTKEENSYKVNVSDTNTFKSGYRVVGNEQHNKEQSQCQNLSEGRVSTAENVEYIATYQLED